MLPRIEIARARHLAPGRFSETRSDYPGLSPGGRTPPGPHDRDPYGVAPREALRASRGDSHWGGLCSVCDNPGGSLGNPASD